MASPATTVSLMGLEIACLTEREAIGHVLAELSACRGGAICTVNLDILQQWRRSSEVRDLVRDSELVVADGAPLVWASRLQRTPLPERIAGSTLVHTLSAEAAEAGASIFLIGGNPGSAEETARRLTRRHPSLRVAGVLCPPVGFEHQPEWLEQIEESLLASLPDLVYIGLPFLKQSRLIEQLRPVLPCAWFLGCGVSFSFVSGELRRAPTVVQRAGFEWAHRLIQEPGRLWRRYLTVGLPFLARLIASALATRWHRRHTPSQAADDAAGALT